MIIAVTYSTENYTSMRKLNVETAYQKGGADQVIEFTEDDIDSSFKEKHKSIFSYRRGAGLWLWKPYIIDKALSMIKEGDYLMYSDAASYYSGKISHLVEDLDASGQDIMVFELPLISKQWTKQETFVRMKCDNLGHEERNQILASFILLKKSPKSVEFIQEYLDTCCDEIAISDKQFDNSIKNSETFIDHRFDQSILSILSFKYDLKPFRDPSQFGKRPWDYKYKDFIYRPLEYMNSNYPTILQLTRREVTLSYRLKESIKSFLSIIPFYKHIELKRRSKMSI